MKRILALCMAMLLLLVTTGCQGEGNANEITIAIPAVDISVMEQLTEEFEEETGIKVNIQHYDTANAEETNRYISTVPTELMAKTGADIYKLDPTSAGQRLAYNELGSQGLLFDFSTIFESDAYFNDENVFLEVLKATSNDEHVYAIPMQFYIFYMVAKTPEAAEVMREKGKYSWEELIEQGKDMEREGTVATISDTYIFQHWIYDQYEEIVDEENLEHPIDREKIKEMAEKLKNWSEEGLIPSLNEVEAGNTEGESQKSLFEYDSTWAISMLILAHDDTITFTRNYPVYQMYEIPYPTSREEYTQPIGTEELYGINEASKNKEGAIRFLQYMMENSERLYGDRYLYTPSKSTLEEEIRRYVEMARGKGWIEEVENLDEDIERITERVENMKCRQSELLDSEISYMIIKTFREYFIGNETMDEVLDELENLISLKLMEQN